MRQLIFTMLFCAFAGGTALAVDVTSCDQTVPAGEVGVLTTDLICVGDVAGVTLNDGATLEMSGHVISGGTVGVYCYPFSCTVHGPGEVTGAATGISASHSEELLRKSRHSSLTITGVNVHDNLGEGIHHESLGKIVLTDVSASANPQNGVSTRGNLIGSNVTANGNGALAILADLGKVTIVGLTATGNGAGSPGSAAVSVQRKKLRLENSNVTGNSGPDLATRSKPKLINTICEHSIKPNGQTWGVCSLD